MSKWIFEFDFLSRRLCTQHNVLHFAPIFPQIYFRLLEQNNNEKKNRTRSRYQFSFSEFTNWEWVRWGSIKNEKKRQCVCGFYVLSQCSSMYINVWGWRRRIHTYINVEWELLLLTSLMRMGSIIISILNIMYDAREMYIWMLGGGDDDDGGGV